MESDFDAKDALDAVEADRRRLGARMTAETRWAAPAQGAGAALLIAGPAAGTLGVLIVSGAGIGLLIAVEWLFRTRSGLSIERPAGPWGTVLLVLLAVLLCGLFLVSLALWALDLAAWIALPALLGGLLIALGSAGYDRIYAREVLRAR